MTTMQAAHRRSLWFNTSSSSPPSSEPLDFLKFHRYSTMPSASTIFEKLQDMGDIRPRSGSKGSKDGKPERRSLSKKDSASNLRGSPKRPSVGNSGLVGSIKGRLSRKRSSPLLSSLSTFSDKNPIIESPTTPTGPGQMLGSPFDRYTLDDTFSPSNANFDASKVNFDGSAFRHLRRDSENESSDAVDLSKNGYRALPLTRKGRRLLHPYSLNDAPSLRSYNKVDMENDLYFNVLLRRINPTGTPVFHEMEVPPVAILDLGCGQGHWVAEASKFFTQYGTSIVGFDLVDMVSDEVRDMPSVSWKRGNFVSYLLPFKSDTFDFVRISNLSDTIPQNRWQHVLSEAYRVLKPGKRMEIIDDELMFPYISDHPVELPESSFTLSRSSTASSSDVPSARSSWNGPEMPPKAALVLGAGEGKNQDYRASFLELDAETEADEDSGSISERISIEPVPSLYRGHSPSEASAEFLPTPTEEEPLGACRWRTPSLACTTPSPSPTSTSLCQDVEGIYETMLEGRYGINPRPHELILKLLLTTFGPGRSNLTFDFRLSLLSNPLDSVVASIKETGVPSKDKKSKKFLRFNAESNAESKLEEECRPARIICDHVQTTEVHFERRSKAMKMLGMNDDAPVTPSKVLPDPINDSLFDDTADTDDSGDQSINSRSSSSSSLLLSGSIDQPSTPKKSKYQPKGLFLYPNKFLDTSPRELEMYIGKHVQTVLGSDAALEEHVLSLRDEAGEPIITEEDWREMMWEYQCSRYAHFNLPQHERGDWELDDLDHLDSFVAARKLPDAVAQSLQRQVRASRTSSDPESSSSGQGTLVRRIRVYEAVKPR